ncbi:E3 ubiquitin-protein ligase TRIM11-like [Erythrolamprus reginae]|uniref:E3 ubiquitin-protein ligase TRIM11-like n=1 Tax=Erythrolamprus reginae TaxID=121349 RepID=UPI00396C37E4
MAGAMSLKGLLEEATCSICLEYFQDPVLIPECGHNFCRGCLSSSWGTSESEASCPQCRQTFAPRSVLPNRQLARVLEAAKPCGGPWGEEGGSFCPKHREPLKLFCKDHEILICLVCDRSKEHKGHSVNPAEEAFPEYQIKVGDCLKAQREQKENIATYEGVIEQTVQKMLDLFKEVKKDVVAEFRELQLWLEAQEKLLLTRMEETEKDIVARKKKGLAKHTEELCSLDHLIQEIEDKLQQPASKLLQDIGSILKKYQAKETYEKPVDLLLEPKWAIWDYSDLPALLKGIMKKLRDTLESGLQLQEGAAQRRSPDLKERKRNFTLEEDFLFPFLLFPFPAEAAAMAGATSLQGLLEEATCSICREYFQDPVLIPECGHNFCRGCLSRSWGTSESEASCPQCRQTFAPRSVLPNRQLARVLEAAKPCGGPWGEEGGSFCPKHREPLKLFCKDHEILICLVCDRSKEHKGDSVIPAEEAFPEYQIKVGDCLKAHREQKEKIATYEGDIEQTVQKMLDLFKEVKKDVVAEFRELQLWLEVQEKLLLTRMEETEKDIVARKKKGLAKHTEELCSLDHLIQEIEDKLQQPASKLLQDIGSILKKYQAKETYEKPVDLLLEPKWAIWDYSDLPALLKGIMKKLRDTLENGLQLQEENIILDRDTIDSAMFDISEDRKSITRVTKVEAICHSPKFEFYPYVRGCQKFSTGRHFWEVIVGDATGWNVGVVEMWTGRWHILEREGKYMAKSPSEWSNLVLTERPTRIRLSLNCEEGKLKFFDARTAALLHTFSNASLVGKILQPCFYMCQGVCMTLP